MSARPGECQEGSDSVTEAVRVSGGSDSVSEVETVRKACSDSFSEAVRVSARP